MTPAEIAAKALALILAGMSAEIATVFQGAVDVERAKAGANPVVAVRTALEQFRKTHERTGEVWAKRASVAPERAPIKGIEPWNYYTLGGDIDGDGDYDLACRQLHLQPAFVCASCGEPGPGNVCYACGTDLCYSCPRCSAPWKPVLLDEAADGMRSVGGVVSEFRVSDDKSFGTVRMIVNTELKDDYGTVIPPSEVARLLKPGLARVDIDHQICKHGNRAACDEHKDYIEGADCTSVTVAKVPRDGKMVESVLVDTRLNFRMPRAKMLYDGIASGKWTEGSIKFTYPQAVEDEIVAKRTNVISKLISVDAYTFTAKGSNPGAVVTEIRMSRLAQRSGDEKGSPDIKTAPEVTEQELLAAKGVGKTPEGEDILKDLKSAVDDLAGGDTAPSSAAPEPASSSAPPAAEKPADGGAPEPTVRDLSQRIDKLSEIVEQVRTAAPKTDLAPGIAALEASRAALESRLTEQATALTGLRTLLAEQAQLNVRSLRTIKAYIAAEIRKLTVPPERHGSSGAETADVTEGIRTLEIEAERLTKEQRDYADRIAEYDRHASFSVG